MSTTPKRSFGNRVKEFFIGGRTFCCCLPVRFGVLSMSFLTIFVAGSLAITLWFEVSTTASMQQEEKDIFILTALVETLLFIVSVIGFAGVVVRKQLFVTIYAYALYVHLAINIVVAAILIYEITYTQRVDVVHACQQAVQNAQAQAQCTGVLNIGTGIFYGVAGLVLLVEIYGVLIITRYMRQLRGEKRFARESRQTRISRIRESGRQSYASAQYSTLEEDTEIGRPIYESDQPKPFDPYEVYEPNFTGIPRVESYGGGTWTHEEIARDEKARGNVEDETEEAPPVYPSTSGATPSPLEKATYSESDPHY